MTMKKLAHNNRFRKLALGHFSANAAGTFPMLTRNYSNIVCFPIFCSLKFNLLQSIHTVAFYSVS